MRVQDVHDLSPSEYFFEPDARTDGELHLVAEASNGQIAKQTRTRPAANGQHLQVGLNPNPAASRRSRAAPQGLYSRTLKTWANARWLPRSRLARRSFSARVGAS